MEIKPLPSPAPVLRDRRHEHNLARQLRPLDGGGPHRFYGSARLPLRRAVEAGIDFALTDISCKYRAMTRFGEELAITVFIRRLSPAKLELGYEMREASTGELKAEGTSGHFFYDRAKGRPVALKKALPEVYRLLEALTTPD